MKAEPDVVVSADAVELAERAAAAMRDAIAAAVAERGVAFVALSGGSTPLDAYRRLAASLRASPDAPRTRWFWVDERAVPPDSPRSNYAAALRALLEPAAIEPGHVFRIRGEEPPEQAADTYAALLAGELGATFEVEPDGRCSLRFDLIVAGLGADGHTASLFPRTGAVLRRDRAVVAAEPGGGLEPRVTLTRPVLVSARRTVVLCSGAEKRKAFTEARREGDEDAVPARLLLAAWPGTATWFVDRAVAG